MLNSTMSDKTAQHTATIARMRIPNPNELSKDAGFAASLINSIGMSQAWLAAKSGISKRRIQYLITGHRVDNAGKTISVLLSYPEQYILQIIADMAHAMAKLKK